MTITAIAGSPLPGARPRPVTPTSPRGTVHHTSGASVAAPSAAASDSSARPGRLCKALERIIASLAGHRRLPMRYERHGRLFAASLGARLGNFGAR